MNNEPTLEKMKKMRLFGMHRSLENALNTGIIHDFSANEFISHLVEAEYEDKSERRVQRLIKNARFRQTARLEAVKITANRGIDKSQILKLSNLNWLCKGQNIIITGLTGTGKTFLACALGLKACLNQYRVEYLSTNKLFYRLKYAKSCGGYLKEVEKISKLDLLILDDFGLEILDKESRISFFEILEERLGSKSLIISSQIPVENWYDIIGEKTIADAICDRLISNAQFLDLKGDSMRKNKVDKS